jgi:hypothetical protein
LELRGRKGNLQKPPCEKVGLRWVGCWATWAVLGFGQRGKKREGGGGLSPGREKRVLSLTFLVLFLQN